MTKTTVYPPVVSGAASPSQQSAGRSPLASASVIRMPSVGSSKSPAASLEAATRPLPTNTSLRQNGLLAREPRIQTESTRDFADFIRSTGPDAQPGPVLPFISRQQVEPPQSQSLLRKSPSSATRSSAAGKSPAATQPGASSRSKSSTSTERRNKPQMEPRSPMTPSNDTADLIDFIRQGPPLPQDGTQHRIPRAVAPFRTTMDSDEFNGLTIERESESSLNQPPSRASASSRTALLPPMATAATQPQQPTPQQQRPPPSASSTLRGPPDPQPVRKRYRVKDPYAIESDDDDDVDEEDDLLTALPKQKPRQEESLIEFLLSTEPSANNGPAPLIGAYKPNNPGGASSSLSASRPTARIGGAPAIERSVTAPVSGVASATRPVVARQGRSARVDSSHARTRELADFLRSGPPPSAASEQRAGGPGRSNSTRSDVKERKEERSGVGMKFWKRRLQAENA